MEELDYRERTDSVADAGAANTESGSPDGQVLEGSCPELVSPQETPSLRPASNWKTV